MTFTKLKTDIERILDMAMQEGNQQFIEYLAQKNILSLDDLKQLLKNFNISKRTTIGKSSITTTCAHYYKRGPRVNQQCKVQVDSAVGFCAKHKKSHGQVIDQIAFEADLSTIVSESDNDDDLVDDESIVYDSDYDE